MTSHNYNTRNNTPTETSNSNTFQTVATSKSIIDLEAKLLSRFDELTNQLIDIKDVVIKRLQIENERLREKVHGLEKKVTALETNHNLLEQYGRRNNLEISEIPDTVTQNTVRESYSVSLWNWG